MSSEKVYIPRGVFLIINIPVFLFLLAGALFALAWARTRPDFPLFLLFALPLWWCLCASVMLSIDYVYRKRSLFLRLKSMPLNESELTRNLRRTFCGYCVYIAVKRSGYEKTVQV